MKHLHSSRSAESYVESLLLDAGWNVWRPLLDDGVDMIATRGCESIRIQVKSAATCQRNNSYRFDLRKKDSSGCRRPRDWRGIADYMVFVSGRSHVWAVRTDDCSVSAIALRVNGPGYWNDIFSEAVA